MIGKEGAYIKQPCVGFPQINADGRADTQITNLYRKLICASAP